MVKANTPIRNAKRDRVEVDMTKRRSEAIDNLNSCIKDIRG